MDARFHLNRWWITGVWPTGAQVRRTTGSSETPDSSQNTTTARRRGALRQSLRPVLGHPTGDGLLVALDRATGGALQSVVQAAAQQLPDVAGMVADPGQPLDHAGDAGQGPVVGVEAVRAPWRRAWSMAASWASDRRGACPVGPALRSAFRPPPRQRACQRLTFWRAPPRWLATSAWERRRQIMRRPAYGRVRRPGGHADRGRCGGRRLVACRHAARTSQTKVTATRRLPKKLGQGNLHPRCGEIVVYRHR
jgi:hypothetical protein